MVLSTFMTFATWWHPFILAVLVVVYGLYLIYDTQLITCGKSHSLSYDDYILGSLLVYIDIMLIFLELLRLFGGRKD